MVFEESLGNDFNSKFSALGVHTYIGNRLNIWKNSVTKNTYKQIRAICISIQSKSINLVFAIKMIRKDYRM